MNIPETWLRFGVLAVEGVARSRPGWLSQAAQAGQDLVPSIAATYLPRLDRLLPGIRLVVAQRILEQEAQQNRWVQAAMQALRQSAGEAGDVARNYPAWTEDHLQRLANLVRLWARRVVAPGVAHPLPTSGQGGVGVG